MANFSGHPAAGDGLEDPLSLHHFGLEVAGIQVALFSECGQFIQEVGKIEYYAAGHKGDIYYQAVPGNVKFSNVTMKRGITSSNALWKWHQDVLDGKIADARKTVTITGYSQDNKEVLNVVLHRAWPVKYTGPNWNAQTPATAALEQVDIAYEGVTRLK